MRLCHFFKNYGIQLRVFDFIGNCLVKYDPEVRNHHYKAFYCMVKGNHIYPFNNVQSLKQKDYEDVTLALPVSSNYYTSEKRETPPHKMIDNVNDILNILKGVDEKNPTPINLVLRDDNLTELLYNTIPSGYETGIDYGAGKLSKIRFKFQKRI